VGRAGLAAVSVVAVVVGLAGAAAWLLLRDTSDPVTVDEAVTSFRTDTEPVPGAMSPIPEGVYVYATRGLERTDALTGVTHRYPARSTLTVTAVECGVSLLWRVLEGRSTEWVYCLTDEGWELRLQDERHTFFGRTERTTYACADTPIRPRPPAAGAWQVTCSTGSAEETGSARYVRSGTVTVNGEPVRADHVRKQTTFSGEIRGFARHDLWFEERTGLPVKVAMATRTRNDSPVGAVTYEEEVTLRLTSLEPRR
jgi:hypothetical protein